MTIGKSAFRMTTRPFSRDEAICLAFLIAGTDGPFSSADLAERGPEEEIDRRERSPIGLGEFCGSVQDD